jgi:hypothetical protein
LENLRRKNQTEILEIKSPYIQTKNTMEGNSTGLEQVEDRLLELDKRQNEEKTEEILVIQLKSCERNMQELSDSIKRPNLRIMGIEEEEEEVKTKGICNIFKKIITENFPNLEKVLFWKAPEHQTDLSKIELLHSI